MIVVVTDPHDRYASGRSCQKRTLYVSFKDLGWQVSTFVQEVFFPVKEVYCQEVRRNFLSSLRLGAALFLATLFSRCLFYVYVFPFSLGLDYSSRWLRSFLLSWRMQLPAKRSYECH